MTIKFDEIIDRILKAHDYEIGHRVLLNGPDKFHLILNSCYAKLAEVLSVELRSVAQQAETLTKQALPSSLFGIDLTHPGAEQAIEHHLRNKIMLELNPPKDNKPTRELSEEEFAAKIARLNPLKGDGTRNQNVVKALIARGRDVEEFYANLENKEK